MKTEKKTLAMVMLFSSLVGVMLSTSLKQGVEDYDMVTLSSIESLGAEIESIEQEIDTLDRAIVDRKEKLLKKEELSEQDDEALLESIDEEIEEVKLLSGVKSVEGSGIRLVVADNTSEEVVGQDINDDIIHDSDIQILLNDLKRAGAEAISINGQRVVSKSEVKCGGPVIKVNKRSSANPFVIDVVGEPKSLLASIEGKGTYGDMLKNVYKIRVEAEIVDKVYVPGYSFGNFEYRYVSSREEGDLN